MLWTKRQMKDLKKRYKATSPSGCKLSEADLPLGNGRGLPRAPNTFEAWSWIFKIVFMAMIFLTIKIK